MAPLLEFTLAGVNWRLASVTAPGAEIGRTQRLSGARRADWSRGQPGSSQKRNLIAHWRVSFGVNPMSRWLVFIELVFLFSARLGWCQSPARQAGYLYLS